MPDSQLLDRITVDPAVFGGNPIVRGRRLAVEHVLAMPTQDDSPVALLDGYPWLERNDIRTCLECARLLTAHERIEPGLGALRAG